TADADEVAFCAAAARLGFDPYQLDEKTVSLVEMIGNKLDPDLLEDFLDAVAPDHIPRGVMWISETAKRLKELKVDPNPMLAAVRDALSPPAPASRPWEKGWHHARSVREAIGLAPDELFDIEELVFVDAQPSADPSLIALGGSASGGGAA